MTLTSFFGQRNSLSPLRFYGLGVGVILLVFLIKFLFVGDRVTGRQLAEHIAQSYVEMLDSDGGMSLIDTKDAMVANANGSMYLTAYNSWLNAIQALLGVWSGGEHTFVMKGDIRYYLYKTPYGWLSGGPSPTRITSHLPESGIRSADRGSVQTTGTLTFLPNEGRAVEVPYMINLTLYPKKEGSNSPSTYKINYGYVFLNGVIYIL